MRRLLSLLAAAAVTTSAGGCAVMPGDTTYPMTVYFAKTPALYEESLVKVMGASVGTIEGISVDSHRVRVDLRIRDEVPIAGNARATIVAASTIGERSVVLHPPWRPGLPRAKAGTVIPKERTDVPVEIDEALAAFTALSKSLDPEALRDVFERGAGAVDGRGNDINRALEAGGTLAGNLAEQDRKLTRMARDLNRLATSLNRRDEKLTALIEDFSVVARALSGERGRLKTFLGGLEALIRQGGTLVSVYREKLPGTLRETSELVMTLKANSASIAQTITRMADVTDLVVDAWDKDTGTITVRAQLDATLRTWLQPVFDAMGWGDVPCLDGRQREECGPTVQREGAP